MPKNTDFEVVKYCTETYIDDVKIAREELSRARDAFKIKKAYEIRGVDYSSLKTHSGAFGVFEVEQNLEQKIKAEEKLTDKLFEVYSLLGNFRDTIGLIDDGSLLWKYYIDGEKWTNIAKAEKVSARWIRERKNKALKSLYRLMPEEYRRYSIPDAQLKN